MQISRGKIQRLFTLSALGVFLVHAHSVFAEDEGPAPMAAPPQEVSEEQVKFYMGFPAFSGLVSTVAEVNQAMRDAAENPMDQWRRQNVQAAISKMPGAIQGLAAVFMSNELHNADLPPMQAMLGGFVDVNAADRYKKFMQNPDASLIPQAGPGFPIDLKAPPPTITSAKIALSDPKFSQSKPSATPKPSINPSEIADLSGVPAGGASSVGFNDAAPESYAGGNTTASQSGSGVAASARGLASVESGSADPANSLGFISSAIGRLLGQDAGDAPASELTPAENTAAVPQNGSFLAGVEKDLALLEGSYGTGAEEEEECVEGDEREECLDEKIFDLEAAKKKKKGPTRHVHGKGLRSNYKLETAAKNWRALGAVISLLPTTKKAAAQRSLSQAQLDAVAEATNFSTADQDACRKCEQRNGTGASACRNVCASRDRFVSAVRAAEGRGASGNSGSSGSGGSGGGSGGGGGRGASGAGIAAAAAIANSVGQAIALVGTTAAQADAAKSIASSEAKKVVTNTKTKADATLHVANNNLAAEMAETAAIAGAVRQNIAGQKFDTVVGINAALAQSASARATRLDNARFTREVEKAQADLLMYVQSGQAALTEYAMKASALVRGLVPNTLGPSTLDPLGTQRAVAFNSPPAASSLAASGSLGVRPDEQLLSPVRAAAGQTESVQSGLERVASALRGSTRQQPLRIARPAPLARAVASYEGTPHVPYSERARSVSSFGGTSRPTHSR